MAENKGTRILDCFDNIPATSMMFLTFWYKLIMIFLWRLLVSSIKEMLKILRSKKGLVFFLERLTGPKEKSRKNELWSWTRLGKKQRMAPSLKEKGNLPFLVKMLKRPDIPSCLTQPKASIKIWGLWIPATYSLEFPGCNARS